MMFKNWSQLSQNFTLADVRMAAAKNSRYKCVKCMLVYVRHLYRSCNLCTTGAHEEMEGLV